MPVRVVDQKDIRGLQVPIFDFKKQAYTDTRYLVGLEKVSTHPDAIV
jgi:hypothetical protein